MCKYIHPIHHSKCRICVNLYLSDSWWNNYSRYCVSKPSFSVGKLYSGIPITNTRNVSEGFYSPSSSTALKLKADSEAMRYQSNWRKALWAVQNNTEIISAGLSTTHGLESGHAIVVELCRASSCREPLTHGKPPERTHEQAQAHSQF